MGEVILHSDHLYLMVHLGSDRVLKVLYRSCEGRKDYSGGMNRYESVSELGSTTAAERFIAKLDTLNELGSASNSNSTTKPLDREVPMSSVLKEFPEAFATRINKILEMPDPVPGNRENGWFAGYGCRWCKFSSLVHRLAV
jgi:hypothetical protein